MASKSIRQLLKYNLLFCCFDINWHFKKQTICYDPKDVLSPKHLINNKHVLVHSAVATCSKTLQRNVNMEEV